MKRTLGFLVGWMFFGVGCGGSGTELLSLEGGAGSQAAFFPDAAGADDSGQGSSGGGTNGDATTQGGSTQDGSSGGAGDAGDSGDGCDGGCPAPNCGAWGTCTGPNECSTSGTETRSCVANVCVNGKCVAQAPTMEMQTCTLMTDGKACMGGGVTCGAYGNCVYTGDPTCGESGSQTRSCTQMQCKSGTCQTVPAPSQSTSCSRATNGIACPGGRSCGSFGSCSCGSGCSGTATRSCWSYKCESGSCVNVGADGQSTSTGCNCGSGKACSGSCGGATCDGSGHCVDCGGNACCNGQCCNTGYGCMYYGGGSSLICVDSCPDNITFCPQPETCVCAYNGSSIQCSGCQ